MGILKFIFIAILAYYIIRFISRALFPFLLRKLGQQLQKNINNQYTRNTKEKDVFLNIQKNTPKYDDKKVGEYVDYEELD